MIFAVVNQKGGVGKSTLAVHLAWRYAEQQRRVALLDADPQQTATRWLRGGEAPVQTESAQEADQLIELADELDEKHDIVVIDGPANLAECSRAALLLAEVALIPCGASLPELEATDTTLRMINSAQRVRSSARPRPLLVLSRLRSQRFRLTQEALVAAAALNVPVATRTMPLREAIADAPGQRLPVWRLGPRGADAAHEVTALLEEIEDYAQHPSKYPRPVDRRAA